MFEEADTDPVSDNCMETIKEEERPTKPKLIMRQKTTRKKTEANAWSSQKKALIKDEKVRCGVSLLQRISDSVTTRFCDLFDIVTALPIPNAPSLCCSLFRFCDLLYFMTVRSLSQGTL